MARRLLFVGVFAGVCLVVAACGGSGADAVAPKTPSPANQPGPPASMAIVSGDAQSGMPGVALPVVLSVLVTDAKGTALPGVTVQFSVDTGGGSLSSTSTMTGSNGVAVDGTWTLGTAVGTQVVSARVSTLAPLRFHAQALGPLTQTLVDKRAVPPSGGTLTYSKSGDPLDGFTITVLPGAYSAATEWTVIADSTVKVPLPPDFTQVGPLLIVNNARGYADSLVTLRMPMTLATNMAVAPFYYDSASGTFEGIPMVERNATSATLATRHFSRDLLALPGNASAVSALRSNMTLGFGAVKIVWVATPVAKLLGTFASSFRPAVDNWEFVNHGDYIAPHGDCEGMSITEMYYHFYKRLGGAPPLYRQFDLTLENTLDNVQGIRFAGSVQGDYASYFAQGFSQEKRLIEQGLANGTNVENLTSTWILLTLKLSGHPVLLGLKGGIGGHAVVAYAATSTGSHTDVQFADPNFPAAGRTMSFESGQLTPVSLSLISGGVTNTFTNAYALAVTSEVPLAQVSARYQEFVQQKAGADRYPAQYQVEFLDNISSTWKPLPSTLKTTDASLNIRHMCAGCPSKTTAPLPDWQLIEIWNGAGSSKLAPSGFVTNTEGTTQYYARMSAFTVTDPAAAGFVDAVPFTVIYQPFSLSGDDGKYRVGYPDTFTAKPGSLATPGSTYKWTVDDGSAAVAGGVTFTHMFTKAGLNTVEVTLIDDAGKPIAIAALNVLIGIDVSINPVLTKLSPGKSAQFTAVVSGGISNDVAPKVTYDWYTSGPSPVSSGTTASPTTVMTFPAAGIYWVHLMVWYQGVKVIGAADSVRVEVKDWAGAWRLTSLSLIAVTPRTPFYPPDWIPRQTIIENYLQQVVTTPSDGMIFLDDNDLWKEHGVYFQVAPPGQGATATYWVPNSFIIMLARDATVQFSHYTSTGTLKTGAIDGVGYTLGSTTLGSVYLLNSIQAQKSEGLVNGTTAGTLTGTMTVGFENFGGERSYRFTAILVTP